jgi:hypothetical protein
MQLNPRRKLNKSIARTIGVATIVLTASTLLLDKSLPYRIRPSNYAQYLWVRPLADVSLFVAIAVMLFSVIARQRLVFVLGLVSLVSLVLFIGGTHSGPNPEMWCYSNLRAIDAAKQQLAERMGLTNGTAIAADDISKYIEGGYGSLKCAQHGSLIIGAIGTEPRCSVHGSISEIEAAGKKSTPVPSPSVPPGTHLGWGGKRTSPLAVPRSQDIPDGGRIPVLPISCGDAPSV